MQPAQTMKCPNCGKSLWFVKDVCPFCKATIALAPAATPSAGNNDAPGETDESWVTLTKCETLAEADAIRTQLEASGIQALLPDEALMQTIAWNVNAYGFVRVQVASRDYESAKEVLSSMKEAEPEVISEPGPKRAELPLSWPMRWLAFTMPLLTCAGLLMFAVAKGAYARQGCERKATELWHWFASGCVCWLVAFIVFMTARGRTY